MNKFLAAIFFLGIVLLLIAARFGFTWAGGEGYEKPMPALVEIFSEAGSTRLDLARGDSIQTKDNQRALIQISERIIVALDQRTEVKIERLFPSQTEIRIIHGRLLARTSPETEKLVISSPLASGAVTEGVLTVVRYDFLDKTTFIPINNEVAVEIKKGPLLYSKDKAIEVNELKPLSSGLADFNLSAPDVVGFYAWTTEVIQ